MDREIGTASPSTCLADGAATRGPTSRMATIGPVQNTFGMERVGAVSAIRSWPAPVMADLSPGLRCGRRAAQPAPTTRVFNAAPTTPARLRVAALDASGHGRLRERPASLQGQPSSGLRVRAARPCARVMA